MKNVDNVDVSILPEGFTYLEDPRMIYHISYATSDNFMGRPVAGYYNKVCILTEKAATALIKVQDSLDSYEQGYRLSIFDAYRPTSAVQDFMNWAKEPVIPSLKDKYFPHLEKHQLFEVGYIAPINSTHSRGSTVDLTILRPVGPHAKQYEALDMGTIFDFFDETSHTHSPNISAEAKQNRQFFLNLMSEHGFENYEKEWWHYTLRNEPFPDTYFNFWVK